ncbi:MAG TPA: aminoglycoside phosphotransferase family protein [Candidatus Paceibacterota bacterium]|nr:aminoglycoside phosphotransferase family protein [Candidatus Paceibacterota bacterium]
MKEIIDMLCERAVGRASKVAPLSGGIVNQTYEIETEKGRYLLQKVAPGLGGITDGDYLRLEDHLRKSGVKIPRLFDCWESQGHGWRVMEFIDHIEMDVANDFNSIVAAKHLGRTHSSLRLCPLKPSATIPGFHDSAAIFGKLEQLAASSYAVDINRLAENILRGRASARLCQAEGQLIHGDPKWKNFLFGISDSDSCLVWLIDWDTLMVGNPLVDLADMVRSFCNDGSGFNMRRFHRICQGYCAAAGASFTEDDILSATKLITLELAARFAIDWFEERYFSWDPLRYGSRKDSSLASARKYVSYYLTMPDTCG